MPHSLASLERLFLRELAATGLFEVRRGVAIRQTREVAITVQVRRGRFSVFRARSFWVDLGIYALVDPPTAPRRSERELLRHDAPLFAGRWNILRAAPEAPTTVLGPGMDAPGHPDAVSDYDAAWTQMKHRMEGALLPMCRRTETRDDAIREVESWTGDGNAFLIASALARSGDVDGSRTWFRRCLRAGLDEATMRGAARDLGVDL